MIDYPKLILNYPWLKEKNHKVILSSDVDGLLSGLLVSTFLDWEIVGYYDSENLLIKEGERAQDCIFLDVEIFREEIRSLGHHIIVFDKNQIPEDFNKKTNQLLNPNLIRKYDKKSNYSQKYPFGTVHLLLKILGIDNISEDVSPLLFTDGVWNSYLKYNKNVLEWADFLDFNNQEWWRVLKKTSYQDVKKDVDFFITEMNKITNKKFGHLNLNNFDKNTLLNFLCLCSSSLSWDFKKEKWCVDNLKLIKFKRYFADFNNQNDFEVFWKNNPFSMSTYYNNKISYTLEELNKLP